MEPTAMDKTPHLDHPNNNTIDKKKTKRLGQTPFFVSPIGFGGYRIDTQNPAHEQALRKAIINGVNLVDTSTNYAYGQSETLIGSVVNNLTEKDNIKRKDLVIVTKAGYVQGENLDLAQKRDSQNKPFPEMVKYMEGCWHCIHEDFLENQLKQSLNRLKIKTIDIFLIHNPEYFLLNEKNRGVLNANQAQDQYYKRIYSAFLWLEQKVAQGMISAYGISSNTFVDPSTDYTFTSLERIINMAETISSDHHFKVIQFPFNLFEPSACFEKNQKNNSSTLLELAMEKKIATLVNRPLNSMVGKRLIRLANFRKSDAEDVKNSLQNIQNKLFEIKKVFDHQTVSSSKLRNTVERLLYTAGKLSSDAFRFHGWEHWDYEKQYKILPQVLDDLKTVESASGNDPKVTAFSSVLLSLIDTVSLYYENQMHTTSIKLNEKLDHLDPSLKSSGTLSQKTLRILGSVPGINCILVGMRTPSYVDDVVQITGKQPVKSPENILKKLNMDFLELGVL
jgi:aryl-alcohol dehydrogenase-like predicted oxidoreductase